MRANPPKEDASATGTNEAEDRSDPFSGQKEKHRAKMVERKARRSEDQKIRTTERAENVRFQV